jgi:hypothetical protein
VIDNARHDDSVVLAIAGRGTIARLGACWCRTLHGRHTHPPPTATLSSKTVHNRTRNRRHDMAHVQRHSEPDGRVKPLIYSTPRTPRSNRARPLRVAHPPAASFAPPPRLASGPVPALALGAAPVVWWSVLAYTDTRLFLPWCPCRDVRWWFVFSAAGQLLAYCREIQTRLICLVKYKHLHLAR